MLNVTFPIALLAISLIRGPIQPGQNTLQMKIFAFYETPLKGNDSNFENDNRGNVTGHCFLEFKNMTNSNMTLGHVTLSSNESVTISRWPPIDMFHQSTGGLWYNRESFDTYGWSSMESYSLTTLVGNLEVEGITTYLTCGMFDGYYLLDGTCANFSVYIWNMFVLSSSLQLTNSNLPSDVKTSIGTKTGYSINATYSTSSWYGYSDLNNFYYW